MKKLILNWLLLIFLIGMFTQLCAQSSTSDNHIVQLENDCILSIDSKFDSSAIDIKGIEKGLTEILSKIQGLIPADSLTINVKRPIGVYINLIIPDMGIAGAAAGGYTINLFIDPENTNFKTEYLYSVLVHEAHHAIRMRHTEMGTLLGDFVLEGFAPHFEMEVLGGERPDYTTFLNEEETANYLKISEPFLFDKIDYSTDIEKENLYTKWFFHAGEDNQIPAMTGFSIGWQIVENYINEHPGATAASLVSVSAEEIAASTFDIEKLKKSIDNNKPKK